MKIDDEMLSAFLDGELTADKTRAIETALTDDPGLQAQFETLMAANNLAKQAFAAMADEPVPLALAAAIQDAPVPIPANAPNAPSSRAGWLLASALVIALGVGASSGYFFGRTTIEEVASARSWLTDIADYHAVYETQVRHLVEVPASEADHIETWLTGTVGTQVRIPDLTEHGLTFEGARLLVAVGKPVAQLIYTDADQRVVALCQIRADGASPDFDERRINSFDMVTWGREDANFVVITDHGTENIRAIAQAAAEQV
ncbi:anti-sigma factor [Rhodophyticola sp. CCM32]|uniref:anti-sigma factor family protein n=1 Tax=Rhodophyticola sp. CCM32 TaxID=2916397 RepID=UPI00107F0BA6|nr:anti-sigma factor [Rhodophyticola sp. CCM32]QBY02533.1 anti-sigma factor [Rhodophyticola sp. CCM32]